MAAKILPLLSDGVIKSFLSKIQKTDGGCWLWVGHKNKDGYGRMGTNQWTALAHRLSFAFHKQIEPGSSCVCHSCDNPSCVNPDHLWLGSIRDNNLDMDAKGRRRSRPRCGAENSNSKLKSEDVSDIKRRLNSGMGLTEIARQYGVTKQAIYSIREGKTWKSIPAKSESLAQR